MLLIYFITSRLQKGSIRISVIIRHYPGTGCRKVKIRAGVQRAAALCRGVAFITSFATILIMWVSHHSIFKLVDKSNKPFLFANGFLLMLVTVVPFPTSLVSEYLTTPAAATACAVYSGIFVVINLAYNLLWWTITHQGHLLNAAVSPAQVRTLTRIFLLGFPAYLLATLLAFLNPFVTIAICSALWIFQAFTFLERGSVTAALPESRM
jgi:TMEM175 potassium channel family protein